MLTEEKSCKPNEVRSTWFSRDTYTKAEEDIIMWLRDQSRVEVDMIMSTSTWLWSRDHRKITDYCVLCLPLFSQSEAGDFSRRNDDIIWNIPGECRYTPVWTSLRYVAKTPAHSDTHAHTTHAYTHIHTHLNTNTYTHTLTHTHPHTHERTHIFWP